MECGKGLRRPAEAQSKCPKSWFGHYLTRDLEQVTHPLWSAILESLGSLWPVKSYEVTLTLKGEGGALREPSRPRPSASQVPPSGLKE